MHQPDVAAEASAILNGTLEGLLKGENLTFMSPTGTGRTLVTAELISRWKAITSGTAVVIVPSPAMKEQWNRHGIEPITRMAATMEQRRTGTVQGHAPESIGLVVVEEGAYRHPGEMQEAGYVRPLEIKLITELFPAAVVLHTQSLIPSQAPTMSIDKAAPDDFTA